MPVDDVLLADTPALLSRALASLDDLSIVGVDVERADWDRYWRAAALVQVGGDGRVALIDPMRLDDLTPVADFLAERTCVLHAMDNDLGPLRTAGIDLPAVEDTSIAAAMLGLPLGLEVLLEDLLGIAPSGDKAAMQRADWEARPLTDRMQSYAAGDVADLPELWGVLSDRLDATGRRSWYEQELEVIRVQPPVEERRAWTRTKGAGRLDPVARARLQSLWERREELAQDTDTAPSRILADKLLVDLAVRPPVSTGELGRRGVRRAAVKTWGTALLSALDVAAPNGERRRRDHSRSGRAPTESDRAAVDTLRSLRSHRAQVLGIDAGVLCPSRTLSAAVTSDPTTPEQLREALDLRPWQWEQLGAVFCEALGLDGPGKPSPPVAPEPVSPPTP